ncbi:MAG: nuclease-related domain-containing protein [Mariprofundaceae bacterium]
MSLLQDLIYMIPNTALLVLVGGSLLLFIVSAFLAKPWLAGYLGQQRIQRELQKLTRKGATVLDYIQLPNQTGEMLHLQHLIITNRHLIAVNLVGYSGNIYGSLHDGMWVRETSQGNVRFPNPIRSQEEIQKTLAARLGNRQEIKTITVFTAGKLHVGESEQVIQASELSNILQPLTDDIKGGTRIGWASQLINNLVIGDEEGRIAQEKMFLAAQGNPKQLYTARVLTVFSASLMLLSMLAVGARFIVV